jgi:hypothetical protein
VVPVSDNMIAPTIKMFLDLSIYLSSFETPFLESTQTYYTVQSDSMIASFDPMAVDKHLLVANYLNYLTKTLDIETAKCTGGYLDPLTRKPIATVLQNVLIERHCDTFISYGLVDLLDNDRTSDLKVMYAMLHKVNRFDKLKTDFSTYIHVYNINRRLKG